MWKWILFEMEKKTIAFYTWFPESNRWDKNCVASLTNVDEAINTLRTKEEEQSSNYV